MTIRVRSLSVRKRISVTDRDAAETEELTPAHRHAMRETAIAIRKEDTIGYLEKHNWPTCRNLTRDESKRSRPD
jgi:hypothetical protein